MEILRHGAEAELVGTEGLRAEATTALRSALEQFGGNRTARAVCRMF